MDLCIGEAAILEDLLSSIRLDGARWRARHLTFLTPQAHTSIKIQVLMLLNFLHFGQTVRPGCNYCGWFNGTGTFSYLSAADYLALRILLFLLVLLRLNKVFETQRVHKRVRTRNAGSILVGNRQR